MLSTDMMMRTGKGRTITFGERIIEDADGVDDVAACKAVQAGIHAALDGLSPQAADIVRRRHGLSSDNGLMSDEAQGFKEIAAHWGITRQEAYNLYCQTMRQLRKDPRLAALL
jgi:DNA-directed RNA polymerase sigma subunit (sigma70/sigma32)